MRYLINYDLNYPEQDYPKLRKALTVYRPLKVLDSQWLINVSGTTAKRLFLHFNRFIDSNDDLLVVCLDNSDWYGSDRPTLIINDES